MELFFVGLSFLTLGFLAGVHAGWSRRGEWEARRCIHVTIEHAGDEPDEEYHYSRN